MNICVTADDYGMRPDVDRSIEQLAAAGAISAVSAMAHRDADLSGLRRLADCGVTVGLHLAFTEVRPFARELGGPDGRLPRGYRNLFALVLRKPRVIRSLAREAEAQADKLVRTGVGVRFVNAHEHVHLFPLLWPIAARLVPELGAEGVRSALGQPIDASRGGTLAAASRVAWTMRPLRDATVWSPLGVGHAGRLTLAVVDDLLARPFEEREGRIRELCVHPALSDDRRGEHEMLASGALKRLLARRGLALDASPTRR